MFLMRFDALKCVFEACVSIFYSVVSWTEFPMHPHEIHDDKRINWLRLEQELNCICPLYIIQQSGRIVSLTT